MTNPSPEITPAPKTDLDTRIQGYLPGTYPWDEWKQEALAAGLDAQLAALGRAVMREAYQHDWCDQLKYECGIDNPDTAAWMIACAKDQPHLTEARWQWLMTTDGLHFDPWKHEEWSETAPEWTQMRQLWETENFQENEWPVFVRLQREAIRYIEDFYRLDQLAIIDLQQQAVRQASGATTLWADFTVISNATPHRIVHSGVVRIERDSTGVSVDAAVFERVEET